MDHPNAVYVSRSGMVGGTVTCLMFAIQVPDIVNASILAVVGAVASFITVKLLNFLCRKFL